MFKLFCLGTDRYLRQGGMVKFRGEREIIFPERGGTRIFFKGMRGGREIFFQLSEEKIRGGGEEKK